MADDSDRIGTDVAEERRLQAIEWTDHSPFDIWVARLVTATGDVATAMLHLWLHAVTAEYRRMYREQLRRQLVRVAAIATAAIMDMDREDADEGDTHAHQD